VAASHAARVVELWRRGNKAWDEGRYADAIVDYEEAAKFSQSPRVFYNLARAYQKVGRYADALTWLVRFKAGASPDELEQTPTLDTRIATLRNQVAVLKVNVNVPGARVIVRNIVVGIKPADRPLEVSLNEGRAQIEIFSEGYQPYQKEYTLLGGSSLEIEVQLTQRTPVASLVKKGPPADTRSTSVLSRWWFWAGAGVLLVGGATAVYALSTEKAPHQGSSGGSGGSGGAPIAIFLRPSSLSEEPDAAACWRRALRTLSDAPWRGA
jgi:tetratricopeptide (TPR) repeat protein